MKLYYKISLILFLTLLVSFGVFYYVLSLSISKGTLNKVDKIIEKNFITTVEMIKKQKLYENPKDIIKKISTLEENQNFLEKFIILNDDVVIFSSEISFVYKKFNDLYPNIKFKNNRFNDDKHFYISKKLTKNKRIIGIYRVDVANDVIEYLNSIFLKYIILFIVIFFIIIFVTINLILVKPIKNLELNSKKIASGNLDARIEVKGNDELSKFTNQFNNMARSLNKIMSEKNTLLRVLSHDLTNQIGSSSSLLRNTIESIEYIEKDEIADYLSYVENDLKNAQDLINFTKKFIAVEAGKIELEFKKTDIVKVIKDSVLTFKNKAKEKNINIILKNDKPEYYSMVDFVTFRYSIVDNLLSNAVKFSLPDNDVFINISSSDQKIYIKFINTGEYIPEEKIKKLFSLTEKTTSLGTKGEKGTGFGLPIVYKFIKIMDAKIEIESNKTQNIFTITIMEAQEIF